MFHAFMVIVKCYCDVFSALTSSRAKLKMNVLQQISNHYFASLVLGLLYALTFCASIFLPHIISRIAGNGTGFRKEATANSIYSTGRIVADEFKSDGAFFVIQGFSVLISALQVRM
jgi:hypothetical protein